jgi:hypothetical protein
MRIQIRQLRNLLKGLIIMADIYDLVVALKASVDALTAKVDALAAPAPATVDLTPVLAAIADVKAQLEPTPATPASPVGPNT